MIDIYFKKISQKINDIDFLIIEKSIKYEKVLENVGIVKGKIEFIDRSILDFREFLSLETHDYRFHWMDKEKNLVMRWDTAPHHKVKTFPFHKHTPKGVDVSKNVNLVDILDFVAETISEKFGELQF